MGVHAASGLDNLVFIDGIMNRYFYLNILRENLKLSVQNLGTLETTLFFIMMTILSIRLSKFACGVSIIVYKF